MVFYWRGYSRKGLSASATRVLVLEDCDSNYKTQPFEDAVITFNPNGKRVSKAGDLNICETVGGCKSLSVATDGGFFVVCENVGRRLTAYKSDTGTQLWGLQSKDEFNSATVSPNGKVYALTSGGLIYGKDTLVIERAGRIVKRAAVGGFDLAVDTDRNALWLVGVTSRNVIWN